MMFNVEICKVMNIGFNNRKEDYPLNGVPLGRINKKKELGAIVCQDLKVGNSVSKPHLRVTRC